MSALAHSSVTVQQAGKSKLKLGQAEFNRIKKVINEQAGISLSDDKVNLVHSRLQKRLRELNIISFQAYCQLIENPDNKDERRYMLNALTTNVTRFFREPHHFKHLMNTSLPPLIKKAKEGGRVRIWSGGCSSGQEPYSIASILLALLPDAAKYDIKILASDIDRDILMDARRGMYPEKLMSKMPTKLKDKFFKPFDGPSGDVYVASPALKSLISFRELNLNASSWPMRGKFDIIFCRNTVIYFDEPTQHKIWTRFKEQMAPQGYLYIGHSERLSGPDAPKFEKSDITTYRLR
ncbi:MAG: protein-glutamate O-methyltransferase [Maricaulaceae bacterium]